MTEVFVTNCNRSTAEMIAQLRREQGWSFQRIANKVGYNMHQVRRYYRIYDMYGPDVFIPDASIGST